MDDTSPTHPRVMRLASLDDERLLNEAWGFVVRCAAHSAAHYTDGFVEEAAAATFGAARTPVLVKAAQSAALLGKRTRNASTRAPGWQLLLDTDELLHIRLKDEVEWERRHRQQLRDPEVFIPVRLRDGDGCRYCARIVNWKDGRSARAGTLDHLDPDGDQLVVACKGCNTRKNTRTADEAGLTLLPVPAQPHYSRHTLSLFERYGVTPRPDASQAPDPAPARTAPQAADAATPRPDASQAPDPAPARTAPQAGDAATSRPTTPEPTKRGPSTDVAGPALPDQVLPGRVGPGQVGPGAPRPRARDGPRGARGRRGRPSRTT